MSRREHYQLNTKHYGMHAPPPTNMSAPPNTTMQAPPKVVNDFPHFADGDVLIVISASRRYKLHSQMLRRVSPTCVALLDEDAAAELSKNAKKRGINTRFRLHLVENQNAGIRHPSGAIAPFYILRRIPLDDGGMPIGAYPDLLGDANENGRVIPQFVLVSYITPPLLVLTKANPVQAWEKVLGAVYSQRVDIGDSENDSIDYILESAGNVLAVAEYLGNVS